MQRSLLQSKTVEEQITAPSNSIVAATAESPTKPNMEESEELCQVRYDAVPETVLTEALRDPVSEGDDSLHNSSKSPHVDLVHRLAHLAHEQDEQSDEDRTSQEQEQDHAVNEDEAVEPSVAAAGGEDFCDSQEELDNTEGLPQETIEGGIATGTEIDTPIAAATIDENTVTPAHTYAAEAKASYSLEDAPESYQVIQTLYSLCMKQQQCFGVEALQEIAWLAVQLRKMPSEQTEGMFILRCSWSHC